MTDREREIAYASQESRCRAITTQGKRCRNFVSAVGHEWYCDDDRDPDGMPIGYDPDSPIYHFCGVHLPDLPGLDLASRDFATGAIRLYAFLDEFEAFMAKSIAHAVDDDHRRSLILIRDDCLYRHRNAAAARQRGAAKPG